MSAAQKFIVWDWNGTLLDDGEAMWATANAMLTKFNLPEISIEFFRDNHSLPLRAFYQLIGISDEMFDECRDAYHVHYDRLVEDIFLRKGTEEILDRLKSQEVPSLILSNHMTHKISDTLKKYNVQHHFNEVLAYEGHGDIYWALTKGKKLSQYIKEKNLDCAQAIIIGDTIEEVEIAKELGLISVAITGGQHSERRLRALNPDYVIHAMAELQLILQERGFVS